MTFTGYVTDILCWDRSIAGGRGLDGTDMTKNPENHSVHCLRDIQVNNCFCYGTNYMLVTGF